MKAARWIFWLAGIYGLSLLVPQYFLLEQIGRDMPPAVTHPEFFYGFIGVAVVWQVAFLVIGYDPARYRPLMLVAVLEKLSFGVPVAELFLTRRVAASTFAFGMFDLLLGLLFLAAWWLSWPRSARG